PAGMPLGAPGSGASGSGLTGAGLYRAAAAASSSQTLIRGLLGATATPLWSRHFPDSRRDAERGSASFAVPHAARVEAFEVRLAHHVAQRTEARKIRGVFRVGGQGAVVAKRRVRPQRGVSREPERC